MGHSPDQILGMKAELKSPVAFVFPGQGSQSLGMLSEYESNPVIHHTFSEASDLLGYDLWDLIQNGPEEKLNKTEYTQPALLTASVALYHYWDSLGLVKPRLMAGHSLGEYSALVCARALSLRDGVKLVAERGRLMQRAVPEGQGSMAAIIGLSDEQVNLACLQAKKSPEANANWVVDPANFNSPQQVVIAGSATAVAKAMEEAKALGAKRVIPLAVSVPSHSALMREAAAEFAQVLSQVDLQLPEIPVIHNVDVEFHDSVAGLRQALVSQLSSPVRWWESIQKMAAKGIETIVECGPGQVLTGLNKRIVPQVKSISLLERGVLCP